MIVVPPFMSHDSIFNIYLEKINRNAIIHLPVWIIRLVTSGIAEANAVPVLARHGTCC